MVKINCCDICYHNNKKLTEAKSYISMKGKNLKIAYCKDCKSSIPKNNIEFVKFAYLLDGLKIDDDFAKKILKGGAK